MQASNDRLSALEKTVAFLQREHSTSLTELQRNQTMLLGIISSQNLDIKEIKISLLALEERLSSVEERLERIETTVQAGFAEILGRLPVGERK